MSLPSHFTFTVSDPDETDLVLVSLYDSRTNYTVRTALPNSGKQTASIMAFAGARFSRASISATDLFKEIKEAKKSANERLATIFKSYGHASVADMAQLFAYIEDIPELYTTKFFNESSVGAGQGRSTRYQDFSGSSVDKLEANLHMDNLIEIEKTSQYLQLKNDYENLQLQALEKYRKYVDILTKKFTDIYKVDTSDKKQQGALTARVFDSARYFLPSGTCLKTSICWITSAREWARIISQFKSSKDQHLTYLAEQLEILFAPETEVADSIGYYPEAPDLIRYTTADETTRSNLVELQNFLDQIGFEKIAQFDHQFGFKPISVKLFDSTVSAGVKVSAQNILCLYPTLNEDWLVSWLTNLSSAHKKTLSAVLFKNFDHHQQMGNQFRVNTHSFVLYGSVAEGRDLNRHRAWGRFIPMISSESDYYSCLDLGYTLSMYLSENLELQTERQLFEADLLAYYDDLKKFADMAKNITWFPHHLILQLLPFAHIMKMWFHGSPKEISYLTKLRVRPGGHINYRVLAYLMAQAGAKSDDLLQGLDLGSDKQPDPSSRAEFLDRG
jgi:thymidylate synthase ThyX